MNPNILIPIYVGIALIGIICIVVDMIYGDVYEEKYIEERPKNTDTADFIISDDLIEDQTY